MKELTEFGLEKVFVHDGQQYVVEFDCQIDATEANFAICRVESLQDGGSITPAVFAQAYAVVEAETDMRQQEFAIESSDVDFEYP